MFASDSVGDLGDGSPEGTGKTVAAMVYIVGPEDVQLQHMVEKRNTLLLVL
jgi:hypothetical protein